MSDERQAFEQIYSIPTGAEWCEKRHIYIHKNYSGLVLHPINESWEAFCEGALWQASRQDFEGEPIGYVVPRMLEAMQAGKYCGISISDEKKDGDIAVYTHPASAVKQAVSVPDMWRDVDYEVPEQAQEVILVLGEKVVHGAWIGGMFWHNNRKVEATKWMPLPQPPNQEGQ